MSEPSTPFYVTGGTLRADAPSYIERDADRDLLEGLTAGEYCFVLNTRQMGKSSLMVRTATRLRQAGVTIAVLDLTAVGQNLTPDQWYEGLLVSLGQQLRMEDELDDFWVEHDRLGPLQRWMEAIHQVVLPRLKDGGKLVLFIDEIDAVRSLPFPADEFFAAIRECYNRRTRDPEFDRLCFCLVGVATPSDLISEARMSPFNVGRRIRLLDFTLGEAGKLAAGMAGGVAVLKRVLYWTAGQPYMTQRLCRAVAEDPKVIHPRDVDRLCHDLFLSQQARESDDHLAFVRNRLLRSGVDLASLLDMYTKVRARGPFAPKVKDDETNELCATLRLAGIARAANGSLRLRNRVYDRVFDRRWVIENMPGAELRRQKEAFRKGIMRASMVGAVAVAVLAGLTGTALTQKALAEEATNSAKIQEQRARTQRDKAERLASSLTVALSEKNSAFKQLAKALGAERTQRLLALAARKKADENASLAKAQKEVAETQTTLAKSETERGRRLLYAAGLNLAQQAIDSGNGERAKEILADQNPKAGQPDLRSFDWRFLAAREREGTLLELPGHRESISDIAATPTGDRLVSGSEDGTVRTWRLAGTPRQERVLRGHQDQVLSVDINPQGTLIASADKVGVIKVWNARTGDEAFSLTHGGKEPISAVKFSPDGLRLATGGGEPTVRLWDVKKRKELFQLTHDGQTINSIEFLPDGKTLLLGTARKGAMLWSPAGELPNSRLAIGVGRTSHLRGVTLRKGILAGRFSGSDPFVEHPGLSLDPAAVKMIRLRLRSTGRGGGQLYWQTAAAGYGETRTVAFPISHDGQFHDIEIRTAGAPNWVGERITGLRIDPANEPPVGTEFELAAITAITDKGEISIPVGQSIAFLGTATQRALAMNVRVSPNGERLAWFDGSKVRVWNVSGNKEEASILGSRFAVSQLLFSADNSTLFGVGAQAERNSDGTKVQGAVFDWDLATHRLRRVMDAGGVPASAALLPDGVTLALGLNDGQLAVRRLDAPDSGLQDVSYLADGYAAAWSPDGKTAASGGADGVLRLWDTESWKTVSGLRFPNTLVKLSFSPDSSLLAVGEASGRVTLWDVAGAQRAAPKRRFELLGHNSVTGIAFSPDGRRLATCAAGSVFYVGDPGDNLHRPNADASLRLWDAQTGKAVYESFSSAASVAYTPDGKYLLAGQESGQVNFANPESVAFLFAIPGNISGVKSVAVSPDKRTFATGAFDGDVRLFDYERKAAVVELEGFPNSRGRCPDIAFSADGKRLAAASYAGVVRIYDPATRRTLRTLQHGGPVHALAFSPDSKSLLTNGRDQILRVWNVETGAELRKLSLVTKAVALAPGGKQVARADADGVVRLWAPGEGGAVTTLPGLTAPSKRQAARLAALERQLAPYQAAVQPSQTRKLLLGKDDLTRPLAHYPLNEGKGDSVRDAAGKNNGTARGSLAWGSDASGRFLTLDGTAAVDLGDAFNFDRTSRFSYGGWVRPQDGRIASVLSRMEGTEHHRGWDLFLIGGKAVAHLIADWDRDAIRVESRDVVAPPGEWHHLFVTYDGSGKAAGFKLYVDGAPAPTTITHDKLQGSPRNSATALLGGRSPHPGDTNAHQPFKGDLQSIRVYDRTLGAEEVAGLAFGAVSAPATSAVIAKDTSKPLARYPLSEGAGTAIRDAAGNRHGQTRGEVSWTKGPNGTALALDGKGYVDLGDGFNFTETSRFSYGGWIRPRGANFSAIMSQMDSPPTFRGWDLGWNNGRIEAHLKSNWEAKDLLKVATRDAVAPAGKWHHVFATYDGSGKAAGITLYVDGRLTPMSIVTASLTGSIRSTARARLGSRTPSGGDEAAHQGFTGDLQEMRIYDRTLTAGEIAQLASVSAPAAPAAAILASKPLARYPLTEGAGTRAKDAAGKQDGEARGTISWAQSPYGPVLSLDGKGYLDLGDAFNFEKNERFSCGGWVRPTADGRLFTIMGRIDPSSRSRGWDLTWRAGRLQVEMVSSWDPGQDLITADSRDVVAPVGQWHHLFATYDGSGKSAGFALYVDGQPVPATYGKVSVSGSTRGEARATIGSRASVYPFPFTGELRELLVYNRTLAPDEVLGLAQTGEDRGTPRLDGILAQYPFDTLEKGETPAALGGWAPAAAVGTPSLVEGRFGKALEFKGDSRMTLPKGTPFDTKTPFSAGAWVKVANAARGTILSTQGLPGPGWEIWTTNGTVSVELVHQYPRDWLYVATPRPVLPLNEWKHVLVTYDGSGKAAGIKIYINGALIERSADSGQLTGSIRSSQPVHVGSRAGSILFTGSIDEVALFSRALSPAEASILAGASSSDLIVALSRGRRPEYLAALRERDELVAEVAAQAAELTLVRYSPDGKRLLIAGKRGDIQLVDIRDGKSLVGLPVSATLAAFSPDGNTVITSDGKKALLWNTSTGARLAAIPTGKGNAQALAFQADGRAAVVAVVERGNSTLLFWDLGLKRVSRRLALPGTEITALEFGPAGKYLAAGALGGQIRLWSLPEMEELAPLRGHRGAVLTLAFAADGVMLASGSRDATVRFWNLLAGREVVALRGQHEQAVTYARFSQDGLSLLTSSADAPVRIWRAPDPIALDGEARRLATALERPAAARPLRVTGVSEAGEIALKWQPVRGVTEYEVRRADSTEGPFLPVARTNKPAYRDRSVSPGLKYVYSVAGVGARLGEGSPPMAVLCTGRQPAPTGVTILAYGNTVYLTWDEIPGASGYVVSRAEKRDGPYTVLAKDLASAYFEDKNVPSEEFYYRVAASIGTEAGTASEALSVRPPWTLADIGGGKTGSTLFTGEQIRIGSFGSRIGGESDQFRLVSQPVSGDAEIVARVDRQSLGLAKAGVMMRASDSPQAASVFAGFDGGTYRLTARTEFGKAAAAFLKTPFPGDANWLKLVRRGEQFTALASADGKTWFALGWTKMSLPAEALVGLAVSGAPSKEETGTFEGVHVGTPGQGLPSLTAGRLPSPPGTNLGELRAADQYANDSAKIEVAAEEDALRFTLAAPVPNIHSTGFLHPVPLVDGTAYTLQFRARADRSRMPAVGFQTAGGDHAGSGLSTEFPVDTEWRTYRFTFTATVKDLVRGTWLYFHLGDATGSIWLADVVVVSQQSAPAATAAGGNEPRLTALPVSMEPALRSASGGDSAVIRFVNNSNRPVVLFWINFQGARQSYGVLAPGATRDQVTATNSPWLVTREGGSAIAIFVPQTALGVAEITQAMLSIDLYPKRSASAGKAQLDLTQTYNARLDEAWHGTEGLSLAALAPGNTVVNGITFDARGIVSTTGTDLEKARPGAFPVVVKAVPVSMPVQALHFLHSTGWMAPVGTEIGRYVIHYADGSTATMPIVYGQDVRDWATGDEATPAPALLAGGSRLYVSTWRNPKPGVAVVSFDFVSAMTTCAPFLVAVTAELPKPP